MSTPARAARRRAERAARKTPVPTDGNHGVMAGWCLAASDLGALRAEVEGRLEERMGSKRLGPITWATWTGPDARRVLGHIQRATVGEAMLAHYRVLSRRLVDQGGHLGVAYARRRQGDTEELLVPSSGLLVVREPR